MSDQVLAGQSTIEDWTALCEPGLRKATLGTYLSIDRKINR